MKHIGGSNSTILHSRIPVCFIVLHLAEVDVLSLIIACFLYVVPIFVFSSYVLYKETQEACAYCLFLNNNLIYGHLNRGWRNSVLGTCI